MKRLKSWCTILAGGLVLVMGILLIPVPGPGGLPVTLAGLAILSSKFPWAQRLLQRLKTRCGGAPGVEGRGRRIGLAGGLLILWVVGGIVAWRVWAF